MCFVLKRLIWIFLIFKIARDAKCDYPSACNAMETLLIHKDLVNTSLFKSIFEMFARENVKLHSGPVLSRSINFAPPLAKTLKHEYSDLELTVEVVNDVDAAIDHINKYSSSHTDSIVTRNGKFFLHFLVVVVVAVSKCAIKILKRSSGG